MSVLGYLAARSRHLSLGSRRRFLGSAAAAAAAAATPLAWIPFRVRAHGDTFLALWLAGAPDRESWSATAARLSAAGFGAVILDADLLEDPKAMIGAASLAGLKVYARFAALGDGDPLDLLLDFPELAGIHLTNLHEDPSWEVQGGIAYRSEDALDGVADTRIARERRIEERATWVLTRTAAKTRVSMLALAEPSESRTAAAQNWPAFCGEARTVVVPVFAPPAMDWADIAEELDIAVLDCDDAAARVAACKKAAPHAQVWAAIGFAPETTDGEELAGLVTDCVKAGATGVTFLAHGEHVDSLLEVTS